MSGITSKESHSGCFRLRCFLYSTTPPIPNPSSSLLASLLYSFDVLLTHLHCHQSPLGGQEDRCMLLIHTTYLLSMSLPYTSHTTFNT
jgi:hypothetical protein